MITFSKLGTYGRLGNQMFQFAAAKAAALNCSAAFAIPVENHELNKHFNLNCKQYSLQQNSHLINKLKIYNETIFNYDSKIESIGDGTDLAGYFQSEKYFKKIEQEIRQDFNFKEDIKNNCVTYINLFKEKHGKEIVSLHVRRTDYVNLQNFHPLCTAEYYNNAMQQFKDAVYLVFSDDITWCKENLKNGNYIFSENKTAAEDLCSMSLCDHNIIANSSFSWWGAWLNQNSNKKVVAPQRWFGPAYVDKNTTDIYCEGWVKL